MCSAKQENDQQWTHVAITNNIIIIINNCHMASLTDYDFNVRAV